MPLKNLPIRAPSSKVLPHKKSVGERIVQALELAALVKTLSRVVGRNKRSRLPSRGGLLAIVGGGVLAVVIAALLKRRGGGDAPEPQPAPTDAAPPAPTETPVATPAATNDTVADHVEDTDPVPSAVEAAKKLDSNGSTAESPAVEETS